MRRKQLKSAEAVTVDTERASGTLMFWRWRWREVGDWGFAKNNQLSSLDIQTCSIYYSTCIIFNGKIFLGSLEILFSLSWTLFIYWFSIFTRLYIHPQYICHLFSVHFRTAFQMVSLWLYFLYSANIFVFAHCWIFFLLPPIWKEELRMDTNKRISWIEFLRWSHYVATFTSTSKQKTDLIKVNFLKISYCLKIINKN